MLNAKGNTGYSPVKFEGSYSTENIWREWKVFTGSVRINLCGFKKEIAPDYPVLFDEASIPRWARWFIGKADIPFSALVHDLSNRETDVSSFTNDLLFMILAWHEMRLQGIRFALYRASVAGLVVMLAYRLQAKCEVPQDAFSKYDDYMRKYMQKMEELKNESQ